MLRSCLLPPLLALSLPLLAQSPAAPQGQGTPAAPGVTPAPNQGISPDDLVSATATLYKPTLIRDPFSAPTDAEQSNKGDLVDDIAIKGRVVSRGKVMAVVADSRGNIRTLGIGYKFRDGELVAISEKTVTFHQWDAGNSNTRVFRTVVKTFKREEGKR